MPTSASSSSSSARSKLAFIRVVSKGRLAGNMPRRWPRRGRTQHAAFPPRIPTKFTDAGAMDGEKQLADTRQRRKRAHAVSGNLITATITEIQN